MRAAVVTAFDQPPRPADVPEPQASGPDEVVVDVLAAGLHPRVRSQANGSHYTSTDALPLVPGIDGIGRAPDGTLRYFVLFDTPHGSMAERVVIDARRSVALPDDADPVTLAAAMNPAMSSWVALRRRIDFQPGQSVLILGAAGNAGRMAVDVAKRLGASSVVGAARRGGDIPLEADALAEAGRGADVVLDYLWGEPAADALRAIIPARDDDGQRLSWVQIGSVAGPTSPIPSAALRATNLQIVGSGQGSVATRDILAELPELAAEIGRGTFPVDARAVPLEDVEEAWTQPSAQRVVIVPRA
jgi:NADPH:quinone reductase-like Zn-dependent oxidoreductase